MRVHPEDMQSENRSERRKVFGDFAAQNLALTPDAGDAVPGTGGVRKARWSRPGAGKRGGVRVVYFNRLADG